MTKKEREERKQRTLENLPYMDKVPENGEVRIDSVFGFQDMTELEAFLYGCNLKNSVARFENEGIAIYPSERDTAEHLRLLVYMAVKSNPAIVEDYNHYKNWMDGGPMFL